MVRKMSNSCATAAHRPSGLFPAAALGSALLAGQGQAGGSHRNRKIQRAPNGAGTRLVSHYCGRGQRPGTTRLICEPTTASGHSERQRLSTT